MKKFALLALILLLQARTAVADQILVGRLGMVGVEGSSTTVFINANIPQCQFGAAYFEGGTVKDRKAALTVAINAKLFDNTVRVDFTQPAGVDTRCYGSNVYMNPEMPSGTPAAMPTVNVIRTPAILIAGQPYTNKWTTSNATTLIYNCSAKGTGYVGKGSLLPDDKVGVAGTASPDWVGYPSTCIYTATGPGGIKTYTEILTTISNAPAPTIAVTRTPSPLVVGQAYRNSWTTTNATALTYNCTAGGTGFVGNGSLSPDDKVGVTGTALAGWVGYPSTCVYTATGPSGTKSFTEIMTTVAPPAPTIAVTRTPSPIVVGQAYRLTWATTNAAALTYNCTANGTGYKGSGTLAPINTGEVTGTALAEWVGYPSTCVYTATGTDGVTKTSTETLTTVLPPAPTIAVTRTPSPLVVGQVYRNSWTTTNAAALTYKCTANGTGYKGSGALAPINTGEVTGTALAEWVGYPSTCVYTATGTDGATKTYTETLTTVLPPTPTIAITRTPSPIVVGQAYRLTWATTNAAALIYNCTANGTGYKGSGTLAPIKTGEVTGTALAEWAGYPSTCVYTATGTDGATKTYTETLTTVAPPAPTIVVTRTPATMVVGQAYTLRWTTTNATALTYNCKASGSGYSDNGTLAPINSGEVPGTALAGWVGYPSSCVYTATGPGGTKTFAEALTTVAPPAPTIAVTRTPSTMVVGQAYTLRWTTANATALTYDCKASGSGYFGNGSLTPINSGEVSGTALAGWVGYPSNCVYTATGPGGTRTYSETLNTVAPAPTISVSRSPSSLVVGQAYTFYWTSSNAVSVAYACSATPGGFSGSGSLTLGSDRVNGVAEAAWVGHPSSCTYTATAADGRTATASEYLTTNAK